jgi:hypothetical protein
MKKSVLFSAIACSIAFYACKKDINNITNTLPAVIDTIYTSAPPVIDPVALSKSVTVGSADSISGALPASSTATEAPVLEADGYDNYTYNAVNGRYVIIYPQSVSGDITGYYVKINGASNYFKISYPKPNNARVAKKGQTQSLLRTDGTVDSAIVIKLPVDIKGDTFSLQYAAYDAENRVSNKITAIIKVNVANKTDNAILTGKWRVNRHKYGQGNDWDDVIRYGIDSTAYGFTCVNGYLNYVYESPSYPRYIYGAMKDDYTFSDGVKFTYDYDYQFKQFISNESTCENPVYGDYPDHELYTAGYIYNAATRELTLIYDADGKPDSRRTNLYVESFKVESVGDGKLVLSKDDNKERKAAKSREGDDDIYLLYTELIRL